MFIALTRVLLSRKQPIQALRWSKKKKTTLQNQLSPSSWTPAWTLWAEKPRALPLYPGRSGRLRGRTAWQGTEGAARRGRARGRRRGAPLSAVLNRPRRRCPRCWTDRGGRSGEGRRGGRGTRLLSSEARAGWELAAGGNTPSLTCNFKSSHSGRHFCPERNKLVLFPRRCFRLKWKETKNQDTAAIL